MTRLHLLGILALVCAVGVAEKNTHQKDDANIDEESDALPKALEDPVKRKEVGNVINDASDADDDEDGDNDLDSDVDDKSPKSMLTCMGNCEREDPCKCQDEECVPDECRAKREVKSKYNDGDGDLDE